MSAVITIYALLAAALSVSVLKDREKTKKSI